MIQPIPLNDVVALPEIMFFAGSELRRLAKIKVHCGRQLEVGADFLSVLHRGSALLYARQSELWGLRFWAAGPNANPFSEACGGDL